MANIKSAKKRISTIDRRNAENKYVKATLSTYIKKFRKMIRQMERQKRESSRNDAREMHREDKTGMQCRGMDIQEC